MEENYSQEIYDTFLSPLDSVNDTSSFRWHSHPTEMDCWCLSKHLNEPLILGSGCQLHQYPVILEITGQIFPQDCHLTPQTYKEMPTLEGSDMVRVAGCWIEPRGGMAAKTQWRRYEEAIYRLARTIEHPDVQLDRICWIGRDGLIKIQLICEVNDDVVSSFFFCRLLKINSSKEYAIPFGDGNGRFVRIDSYNDIPFDVCPCTRSFHASFLC